MLTNLYLKKTAPQPQNSTITDITMDSAVLTFTPSDGQDELYRVQAVITNVDTGERKVSEVQGDTGRLSFTGLTPGAVYSVVARGVTKDGRISQPTDSMSFVTCKNR